MSRDTKIRPLTSEQRQTETMRSEWLLLAAICLVCFTSVAADKPVGLRDEDDIEKQREEALSKLEKPLEKMRIKELKALLEVLIAHSRAPFGACAPLLSFAMNAHGLKPLERVPRKYSCGESPRLTYSAAFGTGERSCLQGLLGEGAAGEDSARQHPSTRKEGTPQKVCQHAQDG
jgi:hypothetical protein